MSPSPAQIVQENGLVTRAWSVVGGKGKGESQGAAKDMHFSRRSKKEKQELGWKPKIGAEPEEKKRQKLRENQGP